MIIFKTFFFNKTESKSKSKVCKVLEKYCIQKWKEKSYIIWQVYLQIIVNTIAALAKFLLVLNAGKKIKPHYARVSCVIFFFTGQPVLIINYLLQERVKRTPASQFDKKNWSTTLTCFVCCHSYQVSKSATCTLTFDRINFTLKELIYNVVNFAGISISMEW